MVIIESANLNSKVIYAFKSQDDAEEFKHWLIQHGCIIWWHDKGEIEDPPEYLLKDIKMKPEKRAEKDIGMLFSRLQYEWDDITWSGDKFYRKISIIQGDTMEVGVINAWLVGRINIDEYDENVPDYVVEIAKDIKSSDMIGYPTNIIEIQNPCLLDLERYDGLRFPDNVLYLHLYRDLTPLLKHLSSKYNNIIIVKIDDSDEEQVNAFALLGFTKWTERAYVADSVQDLDDYSLMVSFRTDLGRQYLDLAAAVAAQNSLQ